MSNPYAPTTSSTPKKKGHGLLWILGAVALIVIILAVWFATDTLYWGLGIFAIGAIVNGVRELLVKPAAPVAPMPTGTFEPVPGQAYAPAPEQAAYPQAPAAPMPEQPVYPPSPAPAQAYPAAPYGQAPAPAQPVYGQPPAPSAYGQVPPVPPVTGYQPYPPQQTPPPPVYPTPPQA